MKRCPRCMEEKPLAAFSFSKSKKDGRATYCKPCQAQVHAKWYRANRAKVVQKVANWRSENLEQARAVHRDAARGRRAGVPIEEEPTREYLRALEGDPCSYCGHVSPRGEVDHITPTACGGTNDWANLAGACASCNRSKGNRPLLTFLAERINPTLRLCTIEGCDRTRVAKGLCNTHWMQQYRAKSKDAA